MKSLIYIFFLPFLLAMACRPQAESAKQLPAIHKDSLVTTFFRRTTGCISGDGGFSVPLSNGRVLWLMGDSHIDDYDPATATTPCLFQVRNTALLQPGNDWNPSHTTTLTGKQSGIKSYLKNNPDDNFFCWPGAGIELGRDVYIYCTSLKNQGTGAFGFAQAGNDFLARVNATTLEAEEYIPLPDFNGINFGVGFVADPQQGWVYAYGQRYDAPQITNNLFVARFPSAGITAAWQYWNGDTWSTNVASAKAIAVQAGVSGTFQVSRVNGKILLLSSELSINCDSGKDMYAATATAMTGPFSSKKLIYSIDDRLQGHSPFFYAAIAHPEYINQKKELLITYAINGYGTCVPDCQNNRMNPDLYRLKGIRVPCNLLTE